MRRTTKAVRDAEAVAPRQELDVRDNSDVASFAGEAGEGREAGAGPVADRSRSLAGLALTISGRSGDHLADVRRRVVVREDRAAPVTGRAGGPEVGGRRRDRILGVVDVRSAVSVTV